MIDLNDIKGFYNVLLHGQKEYIRIEIVCIVRDSYGNILWIEDKTGSLFNWRNIIVLKRARSYVATND